MNDPQPWLRRTATRRALLAVIASVTLVAATSSIPSTARPRPAKPAVLATAPQRSPAPVAAVVTRRALSQIDTFTPAGWSLHDRKINVGRLVRTYLVARPLAAAPGPLAVLIVLPGRNMSPVQIAHVSDFLSIARHTVVVYPAGIGQSWNAGACCGTAFATGVDDVAFIRAIVHDVLVTQPGTSPRSVFLTGYSNGGRMAYRMACLAPGLFAGIAAVEAVPSTMCTATRLSIPVLTVASTADPLLRIDPGSPAKVVQGRAQSDVVDVIAQWRAIDGCSPTAQVTVTGAVTTSRWPSCIGDAQVGLSLYRGGRHAWPAGGPGTPSAQAQILEFFQRFRPGAFSTVGT